MPKNKILNIEGNEIVIFSNGEDDFISLTDLMKSIEGNQKIEKWISNRGTIDFLGTWESMFNPNFDFEKYSEVRLESGTPSFTLSVKKWKELTNSIGIISKKGKFGGTYAHKDIAFKFAGWLNPKFELYVIREFQRLKEIEFKNNNLGWNVKRLITKANYTIHTDAIKSNLLENTLKNNQRFVYSNEAELLNKAVFGKTSKEWRDENPMKAKEGNMRDFASIEELQVLSNLEVLNSVFISDNLSNEERFKKLCEIVISQFKTFGKLSSINKLKELENIKQLGKSGLIRDKLNTPN